MILLDTDLNKNQQQFAGKFTEIKSYYFQVFFEFLVMTCFFLFRKNWASSGICYQFYEKFLTTLSKFSDNFMVAI